MRSQKLLNHNEAAIELQIRPISINKQECDTQVTAMFYHFLAHEGGQSTWKENFIEKKSKCKVIFSKPHQ